VMLSFIDSPNDSQEKRHCATCVSVLPNGAHTIPFSMCFVSVCLSSQYLSLSVRSDSFSPMSALYLHRDWLDDTVGMRVNSSNPCTLNSQNLGINRLVKTVLAVLVCDRYMWVHCREVAHGDSSVVSSHKVVETTVHTVKTTSGAGGSSMSETKTTTMEELKTVEGIITSCMETTTSETTLDTPSAAQVAEGISQQHF